jgi:hypothetical protein
MSTPPVAADAAPAFLTVEEAAEILRVNRKTLYEAIRLEQVSPASLASEKPSASAALPC